jgi:hypothetical protein
MQILKQPPAVKSSITLKRYTSVNEVLRDLHILAKSIRLDVKAIKVPKDIYDDDIMDSVPAKVRNEIGAKPKVVKKVITPKPVPAVNPTGRRVIDDDDEEQSPLTLRTPSKPANKPAKKVIQDDDEEAPQPTNSDSETEDEIPDTEPEKAVVDEAIKELEDEGPKFNIKIDGPSLNTPVTPVVKISEKTAKNLDEWNDELKTLFDQRDKIANIVATLSHSFNSTFEDNQKTIDSAIKYASMIDAQVKANISDLRKKISNVTQVMLPSNFTDFCDSVAKSLKTKLKGRYQKMGLVYQGGTNNRNSFTLVCFIVISQLKDNSDSVVPAYIIAISVVGQFYYINPALYRLPAINDYSIGYQIKDTKEALRYIQEQLAMNDNQDVLKGVKLPPYITNLTIDAIKDVVRVDFTKTDVIVTIKKVPNYDSVANQIYGMIYHSIYSKSPAAARNTKIRYEIVDKGSQYVVIYRLTKMDNITGRTLRNDEVALLKRIFTDEDISKISYILSSKKKDKANG